MRRSNAALAAIVLSLGVAAPSIAQEAPQFSEVSRLEFAPADVEPFLEAVKTVRDAAVEANLAARFAWDVYRWDNSIYFVTWHESLVNFEDPEAFVRAFQGTAVADRAMAAFESTMDLHVREGINEVFRARPDMSYTPASPAMAEGEHAGVLVIRQWPAGGEPGAYEESAKGFTGMLTEMGGPYPVFVSQNVIGRGGYVLAVPFDAMSSLYGENSLEEGLAASGMGERWAGHQTAHRELLADTESFHVMYLPEHSYRPEGM